MKSRILMAGLAGGVAEIVWVLAYGAFAPVSAAEVAREVTMSLVPGAASAPGGLVLGIGIHLMLSIALAGVWAVNFLVVLPLVNPRFVTLMPYAATFLSKALFGAAMGAVLAPGRRSSDP